MEQLLGNFLYVLSILTVGGIYAVLSLGLNVQWGFSGSFNVGIAGFAAIGAYTYAFLTTDVSPYHYGGLNLPLIIGILAAMTLSGIIGGVIGVICIRLRAEYLAIATIGIAEMIRLFLLNQTEMTNGPRGISEIPRAWESLEETRFYTSFPMDLFMDPSGWQAFFSKLPNWWWQPLFTLTILFVVLIIYFFLERAWRSPWGRMMTAIRENDLAAAAAGKNATRRRIEAFILGAVIMGLAGALLAQHLRFIEPTNTFEAAKVTFLTWAMLIIGGSGNNKGAILGAFLLWFIWSASELFINMVVGFADAYQNFLDVNILKTRASFLRMVVIGLFLQYILQVYPKGILPETRPRVKKE